MHMDEIKGRLAEIDEQLAAARVLSRAASKILDKVWKGRKAAVGVVFAELSDEEVLASEELRAWVCAEYDHGGSACYNRYQELAKPRTRNLTLGGYDAREEYDGQYLPMITLLLDYRQDLTEVETALGDWAALWALGRPDIRLGVMDVSCSYNGSWSVFWDLETGAAEVRIRVYGRDTTKCEGTLAEALTYIAEHAWYQGGPDSERDDW